MRTYRLKIIEKSKAVLNGLFSRFLTFCSSLVRFIAVLIYGPGIIIVAVLCICTFVFLSVIYFSLKYKMTSNNYSIDLQICRQTWVDFLIII